MALPIFPGSRPPSIVGANELNFCVRDGREPERRLWRIQRGRSVGSGRRGTKARSRRGHSPGTAIGNRWTLHNLHTKNLTTEVVRLVFALPIFPGSRPPSIVGADELNFCVRDGNRWTLIAINTNYLCKGFRPNILFSF